MTLALRYLQSYLAYSLPAVVLCLAWSAWRQSHGTSSPGFWIAQILWELLSWNLMLWVLGLIVFLFILVFLPSARDRTLRRLANLRERDEREEYITGRASRAAYLSTLSILILMLFFSTFTVNVYRQPESESAGGKRGTLSLGLQFHLFDPAPSKHLQTDEVFFESKDIPFSKSALLLFVLLWQLVAFRVGANQELKREHS